MGEPMRQWISENYGWQAKGRAYLLTLGVVVVVALYLAIAPNIPSYVDWLLK